MGAKSNLLKYLDLANEKKKDFYLKTKLSNGFLDKNENISSNTIEIIISVYRDLNLYWLITGEGEMLRDERPCSEAPPADRDEIISLLIEKIADKERIIADKERIIADKERIIALLEEKIESMGGNSTAHSGAETA